MQNACAESGFRFPANLCLSAMAEPATFTWAFADEHLHWTFEPLPAVQLLRLCAVARQWRDIVAELLRLRAAPTLPQQWSAAMACGTLPDPDPQWKFKHSSKIKQKCMPEPDELLRRAALGALKGMHMLPDIAMIFVSEDAAVFIFLPR